MITPDLEEKISKIVDFMGFKLYDILFLKENDMDILRVCITHLSEAITLESCQRVSEALSPMLDVEISDSKQYFLEVSSKGLERVLKKPNHFILSCGEKVRVRLDDKSEFDAILKSADEKSATFIFSDDHTESYEYQRLKKVKTILEW